MTRTMARIGEVWISLLGVVFVRVLFFQLVYIVENFPKEVGRLLNSFRDF
jgi:hypothetical protein